MYCLQNSDRSATAVLQKESDAENFPLLLVDLREVDGGKRTCQMNSCTPGSSAYANLLKHWNYIQTSSNNGSNHRIKFMIIICHSLRPIILLQRPNRSLERECHGSHHPCILQVLGGSTNLFFPSQNAVLILVYSLPW